MLMVMVYLFRFLKISWGNDHPAEQIRSLREEINQTRVQVVSEGSTCSVWLPDVCLLNQHLPRLNFATL